MDSSSVSSMLTTIGITPDTAPSPYASTRVDSSCALSNIQSQATVTIQNSNAIVPRAQILVISLK